jgi:hypothetical protein
VAGFFPGRFACFSGTAQSPPAESSPGGASDRILRTVSVAPPSLFRHSLDTGSTARHHRRNLSRVLPPLSGVRYVLEPFIEHVVQVNVGEERTDRAALAMLLRRRIARCMHRRRQSGWIRAAAWAASTSKKRNKELPCLLMCPSGCLQALEISLGIIPT